MLPAAAAAVMAPIALVFPWMIVLLCMGDVTELQVRRFLKCILNKLCIAKKKNSDIIYS